MKITALETLRTEEFSNVLWVRVHTDSGVIGLGETFYGAGAVEALLPFALHWVGLPFVPALVGVVTYRLFNFWLPMVPATAVLPAIAELRAEFAGAEAAADRG